MCVPCSARCFQAALACLTARTSATRMCACTCGHVVTVQMGGVLNEGAALEAETEAAARYRGRGAGREVEDNARMRQRMWERGLGRGAREAVRAGDGPTGASENHSAYRPLAAEVGVWKGAAGGAGHPTARLGVRCPYVAVWPGSPCTLLQMDPYARKNQARARRNADWHADVPFARNAGAGFDSACPRAMLPRTHACHASVLLTLAAAGRVLHTRRHDCPPSVRSGPTGSRQARAARPQRARQQPGCAFARQRPCCPCR